MKIIVVVMIGGGAATGNDDNDSECNSANVGLAVIRQSVAFPLKASVKKRKALASIIRAPPRVQ